MKTSLLRGGLCSSEQKNETLEFHRRNQSNSMGGPLFSEATATRRILKISAVSLIGV
jgi:hypothetical protein